MSERNTKHTVEVRRHANHHLDAPLLRGCGSDDARHGWRSCLADQTEPHPCVAGANATGYPATHRREHRTQACSYTGATQGEIGHAAGLAVHDERSGGLPPATGAAIQNPSDLAGDEQEGKKEAAQRSSDHCIARCSCRAAAIYGSDRLPVLNAERHEYDWSGHLPAAAWRLSRPEVANFIQGQPAILVGIHRLEDLFLACLKFLQRHCPVTI